MKAKRKTIIGLTIIWMAAVLLFIALHHNTNNVKQNTFVSNTKVSMKEDKVGAKIKLKEAIHGTGGITYRYIVKTDCDKWDFETRYVTETPLKWVDGKTSAVEVLIYSTQVRYNNTVYASGTYYTVPLLDDIASENKPLDEWQKDLQKQAYQAYLSEPRQSVYDYGLRLFIIILPITIILYILITAAFDKLDQTGKVVGNGTSNIAASMKNHQEENNSLDEKDQSD